MDSGYRNGTWYLAPFKTSAYRIPEFFYHSAREVGGVQFLAFIPSFSTRTPKHIILACIALHSFIHDNKLYDKEFDRGVADEDYQQDQTSTTAQTQGDEDPNGENEDTKNAIRSRIVDVLVSARGR